MLLKIKGSCAQIIQKETFFRKSGLISYYMESGLLFAKAGGVFVGLLITPIFIRFSCRGGAGEEICTEKKMVLLHDHEVSSRNYFSLLFLIFVILSTILCSWHFGLGAKLEAWTTKQTNGKMQERISEARICLVVSKMVLFPHSNLAHFLCFNYFVVLHEQW